MKYLVILSLLMTSSFAQDKKKELPLNNDFVNFSNIKNILKKDGLQKTVAKKKIVAKVKKKKKINKEKGFYNLPSNDDALKFYLQYWLVKNNTVLRWDFQKPDYGLEDYFSAFLRDIGELGIKFTVLYINSSNMTHFAFPYGRDHYLFVVSVPFIKLLDLTKLQISIMLYEDMQRVRLGYFDNKLDKKVFNKIKEGNFYKGVLPKQEIKKFFKNIDQIVFDKGFSFKEQYSVTKRMDTVLKNKPKYWQNYYAFLEKLDEMTKTNLLYKEYSKIFPSPELQLKWLSPVKR